MIKVTVTINYQGKNYVTNVLTDKETGEETIKQMAFEQVRKQWSR
ncbi:BA3454 family stress response protein [Bacillus sp. T3]|nr:BA3454 family stress response protein [Bacillus sp. T3]